MRSPLFILICLFLVGCTSTDMTSRSSSFAQRYADFNYCEVIAEKQRSQITCGAAVLSCLLNYWDINASEPIIVGHDPPQSKLGYPILQLRDIARRNGMQAYAVSMNTNGKNPTKELINHINKGRPVIAACRLPQGRYFGTPIPIVESLDRRVILPDVALANWKEHYVLVIGYSSKTKELLLMDPSYGIVRVDSGQFATYWATKAYASLVCTR